MKVSIEIPKSAIKKAAYLLMSQAKTEKEEENVTKIVESLESEECVTISNDFLDDQADEIHLIFAVAALATKAKEMEEDEK